MAMRQYIGARYVPKYFENSATGDSTWAANTAYEPLTMVIWNTNTYTSKKPVPANVGNPAENPQYWVVTSNVNAQITEIEEQIGDITETIGNIEDDVDDVKGDMTDLQGSVNSLSTRVSSAESRLTGLSSEVGELSSNLSDVSGNVSTLSTQVSNVASDVSDVQDDISDIQSDITVLQEEIGSITPGGGWGTPDTFTLPFTPTVDGFCMINVTPGNTGASYLYVDEDNVEWCRGYATSNAQQYTLSFPVRKNHTYSVHLSSNIGNPVYHFIPFSSSI